jgi:polyferredoxin
MLASMVVLASAALAMAGVTAYLLRILVEARRRPQAWIALFLLAMMGEMWIAAVVALAIPTARGLVVALSASGGLMVASVVPLLAALARTGKAPSPPGGGAPIALGPGIVGLAAALVLVNEFLMGWGLVMAAGASGAALTASGFLPFLAAVVDSPWFLFTMGAEMLLTAMLLRARLPRPVLAVLLAQSAIMIFSPPALGSAAWRGLSVDVSSALMIGLFIYLFEDLYRHRQPSAAFARYLVELLAVYALMMAGLFVWLYEGDPTAFVVSILAEMVVFYVAVVEPDRFAGPPGTPWQLRPHWTFAFLSFVFLAEVFMGAVLSVQLEPAQYAGGFPFVALYGPPGAILTAALTNGFWFVATAVSSTWFLAMMGIEMGALVVFKMRESRNLENRVRMGLMLGSYAAFAVFYPSIYLGLIDPNAPASTQVPVLGWSMGIGSAPLAVGVFGVVLLTYVIMGALTVLFGRRVVCSVFCTAPLMYQGTALDEMKSFNRSSPVARKYLSSRFSGLYSGTMAAVMVALVGTSVLSYLDSIGATSVYVLGTDPTVFLFTLSFSITWYALFVMIPYAGNYNCVTMGWCYTGTVAQAFQKIGFFKLKVRDRRVCQDCTTVDCAKGCPVGLVDMPGHFRTKGEFRSTKCCGVGDCVEACPYDNLYVSDVRHTIRRLLGRPESRPRGASVPTPVPRGTGPLGVGIATLSPPEGAVLLPMAKPNSGTVAPAS